MVSLGVHYKSKREEKGVCSQKMFKTVNCSEQNQ